MTLTLAHGFLGALEMIGVMVLAVVCGIVFVALLIGLVGIVMWLCAGRGY